jgi:hypothetical protein
MSKEPRRATGRVLRPFLHASVILAACAQSPSAPSGPGDEVDAAISAGTGGVKPAGQGGSGGSPSPAATGGSGASAGATGGAGTPGADAGAPSTGTGEKDAASPAREDASAPPASGGSDAGGAAADAPPAGPPGGGQILFELKDPLPPLVMSHPSGDISWFDDATEGKVVRLRAVDDAGESKERGEFDMDKGILKNGDTVWVGWKAKLEIPNPGAEWRNIFQEKSYGSYQENVPFCLRVDAGTMRLLDQNARTLWSRPPLLGKWFTIVMKIVYATPPSGTIETWIDGQPQPLVGGGTVAHLGTWGGGTQNMHWGVYRTARISGTDVHYISHLRVATTRELATPP